MRLIENAGGEIVGADISLRGRSNNVVDIHSQTESAMQDIRGADVSMIFQEPTTSLNPVLPIGFQISEAIMRHQNRSKNKAMNFALETLRLVRVPEPESRLGQYPHGLSGGMRQRVMISNGEALRVVQEIIGDASIATMAGIYTHVLPSAKREAADWMGRLLA